MKKYKHSFGVGQKSYQVSKPVYNLRKRGLPTTADKISDAIHFGRFSSYV